MPVRQTLCFVWNDARNARLLADRGIEFEVIVFHIERGDLASQQMPLLPMTRRRIEAVAALGPSKWRRGRQ